MLILLTIFVFFLLIGSGSTYTLLKKKLENDQKIAAQLDQILHELRKR
ncbi:hypothetical protein [Cohnella nanjingensis]|uniref:Uncharacterized protein n=1 Tax=Cohnella nanjingensis TaxID=1387779 RepID=A0A7X0VG75_9BACL|nr:hypothetical protein [Cohnella nanjingensis]MBB6672817.1 hypothetical protein [Cohnella nanjingensis]